MKYDLVIIGSGPAGAACAFKASELKAKSIIFESSNVGGVCLNHGCIPTKTILESAHLFYKLNKKAHYFGINAQNLKFEFTRIMQRKNIVIQKLRKAIMADFVKAGIEFSKESIDLKEAQKIGKKILIATGTRPKKAASNSYTTDAILDLANLPKEVLILGAGAVGLEFASFFASLGVKVTVQELAKQILPNVLDVETAYFLQEILQKNKGIKFYFGKQELAKNPDKTIISCIGRDFETAFFANSELKQGKKGELLVNDYLETNLANIYAAGDINAKAMLAHYASRQGEIVAINACNDQKTMKFDKGGLAWCIFTNPQVAVVGEIAADNSKKVLFASLGASQAIGNTEGLLRVVYSKDETIKGIQIIHEQANTLLSTASIIIQQKLKIKDLKAMIWAHPTINEIFSLI